MGRTCTMHAIATEGRGIKMILPYVFVAAVVVLGVGLWKRLGASWMDLDA
jgi:hypothetical protein